jgi:hypothetical protein
MDTHAHTPLCSFALKQTSPSLFFFMLHAEIAHFTVRSQCRRGITAAKDTLIHAQTILIVLVPIAKKHAPPAS